MIIKIPFSLVYKPVKNAKTYDLRVCVNMIIYSGVNLVWHLGGSWIRVKKFIRFFKANFWKILIFSGNLKKSIFQAKLAIY